MLQEGQHLSFVEGFRSAMMASRLAPDDPLERLLTDLFGPRANTSEELPSALEMWEAFEDSRPGTKPRSLVAHRVISTGCKANFPPFALRKYGHLVRPAWIQEHSAVLIQLLSDRVAEPVAIVNRGSSGLEMT